MKNKLSFLLLLLLCAFQSVSAQTTEGFRYQAIARNPTTGVAIAGSALNLQFLIRENTATSPAIYIESHNVTTNNVGLFSVEIGKGSVLTGNFSSINWESAAHFLETQIGGTSIGTEQLVYVPYSKYADKAGSVDLIAGNGIAIMGGAVTNILPDQVVTVLGTGATTVSGTYPNFTIFSTDSQQLHFSNDTLYLVNGGSIYLGGYLDNTDSQSISLSNNHLGITGSLSMVDLTPYLDNTDGQTLSYDPATGILSISNGNAVAIPIPDGSETHIIGSSNVNVTGIGTSIVPYIISILTKDVVSTNPHLTVLNGTGQIVGTNNMSIDLITSNVTTTGSAALSVNSGTNGSIIGASPLNINLSEGNLTTTTSGLTISGTGKTLGSNLIIDVATNALNQQGLVAAPTLANTHQVWATDASGNPSWTNSNATIVKKDVTSSTIGMNIGNGTNQVAGTTNMTVDYNLPTGIGALASGTQGVLGGSGNANTYVGADGQLHALPAASPATTNVLTSNGNDISSIVNGVTATTTAVNSVSNTSIANVLSTTVNGVTGAAVPMVNSISNTSAGNNLSTTVNGISSSPVSIINSNTLSSTGNTITNETNGVTSSTAIINTHSNALTKVGGLVNTVNGVTATTAIPAGAVTDIVGFNGSGVAVNQPISDFLTGATTVSNTSTANDLSTTVNGVTGAAVPMVNSISNTSAGNNLSTTVNGVASAPVSIINSNAISLVGDSLTTSVNGVTGVGVSLAPYKQMLSINGNSLSISNGNNITLPNHFWNEVFDPTTGTYYIDPYTGSAVEAIHYQGRVLIGDVNNTPFYPNIGNDYGLYVSHPAGIVTTKLRVALPNTTYWYDVVFHKDYKLMSLAEKKLYVMKYHHLPAIASDKELVEKGIDMREILGGIVKELEEANLHLMRMDEELQALKAENAKLNAQIKSNSKKRK